MAKIIAWVGAGLILFGAVLGFVSAGECGSVFQPRDDSNDTVNRLLGGSAPPDCSIALDLTWPVWILIGVGGVMLLVGAIITTDAKAQLTADTQDDKPSGKHTP